jgi:two-component system chemotaxis response regulator CheB
VDDAASRVVVVGASAGGVFAFLKLAAALPADFPAPILFVQHIGAHRSQLPSLVSSHGPNRAVSPDDGAVPEPGTIYIAPSDQHMMVDGGRLRLSRGPKENHARPAIDPLFRSAALEWGSRVIGVVLTGMLDDGSAGLRAVKDCGGIAVVQDPSDAAEPSMPESAMSSTNVDHVVPLDQLAGLLYGLVNAEAPPPIPMRSQPSYVRLEHDVSLGEHAQENLRALGKPSTFTCPDCGGVLFELSGAPIRYRCHTGHAFGVLSLAHAQEDVTDATLWSALRSMQEKEAILRTLASVQPAGSERGRQALEEADEIAVAAAALRKLVQNGPAGQV